MFIQSWRLESARAAPARASLDPFHPKSGQQQFISTLTKIHHRNEASQCLTNSINADSSPEA